MGKFVATRRKCNAKWTPGANWLGYSGAFACIALWLCKIFARGDNKRLVIVVVTKKLVEEKGFYGWCSCSKG